MNRLTQITYPDATYATFAYDGVGNRTYMRDTNGFWKYNYDKVNRLTSTTDYDSKTTTYSYMTTGQRYQMTDPDGGITSYSYDKAGKLVKVKNSFDEATAYTYNAAGLATRVDYANLTYTTYAYDDANRLTSLANKKSDDSVISGFVYEYDKSGNRTKVTLANGDYTDYGYDKTYQLTSEVKRNSGATTLYSYTYTYDGVGNRETTVNYDGSSTTTYTYSYNNLNQLTSRTDGTTTTTYSYDANGNLTQKTTGVSTTTTYAWTYENKMRNIILPDASTTTFAYNPEGLRIKKEDTTGTTKYVLDGLAVLKEYDGSNNVLATYTPGISLRKNSSSYFYHYDALGSTTETTDSSQDIATTYVYEAFGNLLSSGGTLTQPYRFVGQQSYYTESDLGLQLLGQRWYDPEISRFISRDPIGTAGGLNLYAYVKNNPIRLIDPTGLVWSEWDFYWHYIDITDPEAGQPVDITDPYVGLLPYYQSDNYVQAVVGNAFIKVDNMTKQLLGSLGFGQTAKFTISDTEYVQVFTIIAFGGGYLNYYGPCDATARCVNGKKCVTSVCPEILFWSKDRYSKPHDTPFETGWPYDLFVQWEQYYSFTSCEK